MPSIPPTQSSSYSSPQPGHTPCASTPDEGGAFKIERTLLTADGRSGDYGHVISSHMYGYLQSSTISATPGGVYDVYSWMRGELDADDSGGSWVLRVYFYNSSGTQISSSDAASGGPATLTTAWQRKGGQVAAPAGTASLKVWLMVYMNSGWAAFDDVSVTQPQTATLTYDAENRLVSVSGSGMTASFVYDGDGNRVQSTINGVTTVYIGNYYEKSGDNITQYYYAGAMRVAMKSGSAITWLLGDHLGSTSLAVNGATGQGTEQRYMPFGEVRYTSGTLPTKYTFTGQYSNVNDFGLMYYGARWYDVSLGRFAQADTIIPGAGNPLAWDRYACVYNNPVNGIDPSGHCPICIAAAVGAIIGGGINAYMQYSNTGTIDLGEVAGATVAGAVSGAILAVAAPVSIVGAFLAGGTASLLGNQAGALTEALIKPSGNGLGSDFAAKGGIYDGSRLTNLDRAAIDFAVGGVINGAFSGAAHAVSKYTNLVPDPFAIPKPSYSNSMIDQLPGTYPLDPVGRFGPLSKYPGLTAVEIGIPGGLMKPGVNLLLTVIKKYTTQKVNGALKEQLCE